MPIISDPEGAGGKAVAVAYKSSRSFCECLGEYSTLPSRHHHSDWHAPMLKGFLGSMCRMHHAACGLRAAAQSSALLHR